MPTPDPIQGIPLPTYDDPAAIPDDLARITGALLQRSIPRFSTTAQRDAAFPSPTDGQACWISAEAAVHIYSTGWRILWRGFVLAEAIASSTQSMANSTEVTINFASAPFNSGGAWSAAQPSRLTCTVGGFYMVNLGYSWASAAGGSRIVLLKRNGVTYRSWAIGITGSSLSGTITVPIQLAASDYIQMAQYQASGAALSTHTQAYPSLSMNLIG